MRTLRTLIIGLSSILPMLVLQYEAKTGLGQNWEHTAPSSKNACG